MGNYTKNSELRISDREWLPDQVYSSHNGTLYYLKIILFNFSKKNLDGIILFPIFAPAK